MPCSFKRIPAIIPYQVITGNYNVNSVKYNWEKIIPYQVITGNYNKLRVHKSDPNIIPYQVITGNYNTYGLLAG